MIGKRQKHAAYINELDRSGCAIVARWLLVAAVAIVLLRWAVLPALAFVLNNWL